MDEAGFEDVGKTELFVNAQTLIGFGGEMFVNGTIHIIFEVLRCHTNIISKSNEGCFSILPKSGLGKSSKAGGMGERFFEGGPWVIFPAEGSLLLVCQFVFGRLGEFAIAFDAHFG